TGRDVDLSGYELASRSLTATNDTLRHRFAPGTILPPGRAIAVFGGGSPNPSDPIFGGAQIVKASRGSLSLTNTGGVITVRKPTGEIVTSVAYGSDLGLRADLNQSLTRAPDIIGQFVSHSIAAGNESRRFSPGTRIDGSIFSEIVHALSHRLNHFAARALWFRQLPRRPT
ncbi:MAG TPA: lamin tail domain-containing protein, partial [Pyrinomonadaceae bacterium]|nr:lamin tail domain-containing protein [Pyrinomonadaceae bacterium]